MRRVDAYTDGSSRGNPGAAGWAVLIEGVLHSDWVGYATNNEMELRAIVECVQLCPPYTHLFIHTDSKLCIGWLSQSYGMRNKQLIAIAKAYFIVKGTKKIVVTFKHVKGHSGDPNNQRVDRAARAQSGIALNLERR